MKLYSAFCLFASILATLSLQLCHVNIASAQSWTKVEPDPIVATDFRDQSTNLFQEFHVINEVNEVFAANFGCSANADSEVASDADHDHSWSITGGKNKVLFKWLYKLTKFNESTPCENLGPTMKAAIEELEGEGYTVISISIDGQSYSREDFDSMYE